MENLYKSKEWKDLDKVGRAQLLLVNEGLKKGTIIGGNYTSFMDILKKTGLDYKSVFDKRLLYPVFEIAKPEVLAEKTHKLLALPKDCTSLDFYNVIGDFLGYPECCIREYSRERTPAEKEAVKIPGKRHLTYRFGQELEKAIKSEGKYPDVFDYVPPSFTPCSIDCPEATKTLASWKDAIETLDPEAAKELVYFNRNDYPQMLAHRGYLREEDAKRNLESKLRRLRGGIN